MMCERLPYVKEYIDEHGNKKYGLTPEGRKAAEALPSLKDLLTTHDRAQRARGLLPYIWYRVRKQVRRWIRDHRPPREGADDGR